MTANIDFSIMSKIITLLTILFVISCTNISKNLPDWYLKEQNNDAEFLYGVGAASNKEDSIKDALNKISEKILVTISSNYQQQEQESLVENSSLYSSYTNKQISSNSIKIELPNYVVENSEEQEGVIYSKVKISRSELIDIYQGKEEKSFKKINDIENSLTGKTKIYSLLKLQNVKKIILENEQNIKILKSISKDDAILASHIAFYDSQLSKEEKIKSSLNVQINSPLHSERFKSVISTALNNVNIPIIKKLKSGDKDGVILVINSKDKYSKIYNSHIAQIQISIKAIENYGSQIASNNFTIKGQSSIDSTQATINAAHQLQEMIDKKGIFYILGIK